MVVYRYPIRVPAMSETRLFEEDLKDHAEQTHTLKFIRGHFIDLIVDIEKNINILIQKSFISDKSKLLEVFKKNLLNSKSFTLKNKADLLNEIILTRKDLKQDEAKLLNDSLKILIDERNRWAHGSIFFQQEKVNKKRKLQSYLEYVNSKGETKEIKLTNKYFDKLNDKLNKINEKLIKLLKKKKLITRNKSKAKK